MDTLTHALSGALLARATAIRDPRPDHPPLTVRTGVGFAVAAFPDIDFLLRWVDPLMFLNWHRGHTHSIVLLPLWALLLAVLLRWIIRGRYPLRALLGVCALALAIHIAGDVITSYGTRVLVPLSDVRVSLPTTFIIDPWFTGIIVLGLLASWLWRSPRAAAAGLALLVAYVGLQGSWYREALELARHHAADRGLEASAAHALPQPFLPVHWKLIIRDGDAYHQSYVRLHGAPPNAGVDDAWWRRIAAAYRALEDLEWTTVRQFGEEHRALAREAWTRPEFASFRKFAMFPYVYRLERGAQRTCAWFSDLRFVLDELTPPFRYGMCRANGTDRWSLERLTR
ncbi:MAG: metal-dependent hydrolase [Gammaproteobacteria bacterium]|nr:metal-dependent hydrolase [Gammaproteobacteria bacterium]NIR82514.1 metal-dependent hydrolase [Gammaproteobacteria bacterium]NIU03645.1 metal-dependent hydrolase [Gammaproteobacteria bacterium]NIX84919.1 metal-dependent hydrolase [Gammaproteobacteria bacterium]